MALKRNKDYWFQSRNLYQQYQLDRYFRPRVIGYQMSRMRDHAVFVIAMAHHHLLTSWPSTYRRKKVTTVHFVWAAHRVAVLGRERVFKETWPSAASLPIMGSPPPRESKTLLRKHKWLPRAEEETGTAYMESNAVASESPRSMVFQRKGLLWLRKIKHHVSDETRWRIRHGRPASG